MANWKKVVVSGSQAELNSLTLDTALAAASGGTGVSDLSGQENKALTVNSNADGFTFADATAPTGTISASAAGDAQGQIKLNGVNINITDLQVGSSPTFVDIELGGTGVTDTTITKVTSGVIAVEGNTVLMASDGGIVSGSEQVSFDSISDVPTGLVSGSEQVVGSTFTGGQTITQFSSSAATRIFALEDASASAPAGTISSSAEGDAQGQIKLNGVNVDINNMQTDDSPQFTGLTLTGDAVFGGNLTVQGTASFENTENLQIKDRFISLASGSTGASDGGIVIEQTNANGGKGAVFAYDGLSTGRWGIDTAFNPTASTYTPAAFMSAVVEGGFGVNTPAAVGSDYVKKGNIFVGANQDIYIYS